MRVVVSIVLRREIGDVGVIMGRDRRHGIVCIAHVMVVGRDRDTPA